MKMPKTLSELQERMIAKVLTLDTTNYVWVNNGEVNSLNNMKAKGLVVGDCYGSLQIRHLTERVKNVFFLENEPTFMIQNFHGEGWLIFDARRYVCKVYKEPDARRVVEALKLLARTEATQSQAA
jgi:hypothetical protein